MAATATSIAKAQESGSFFSRIPWYFQMALLMALVGLLIFATDALLYSETRTQTEKILSQVEALKAKNAQGSIIRQNLEAAEKALQDKRAEIEQLRVLLPDQVEISSVYENIRSIMAQKKLDVRKFAMLAAVPADYYTSQPIDVEVTGTYDKLGEVFSQLGFYKRIVSVSDVDIKQAEEGAQAKGRSINAKFLVTAYWMSQENLDKLTMKKAAPPNAQKPGDNQQANQANQKK
ncbi:MAG TPA: type 4a pilus biogenesis protein PilO [Blastocatellia bacterium]|nr:type 4a pilus biogenesis protein PilO [Blastocatellia bacterium]